MKHRFTLYGFGFAMGLILVFFFLGGKNASCNWLPNDRMLKIIRSKNLVYSDEAKNAMKMIQIDTALINQILVKGNIDFSKSNVKNNPCRKYFIEGEDQISNISIWVELCDSIATIKEVKSNE